jgi:N-acetylneuraminic acid mutarotase
MLLPYLRAVTRLSALTVIATCICVTGCESGHSAITQARQATPLALHDSSMVRIAGSITSNSWTTGAPMPTKRFFAGATAVGTKIYVIGGYNNTGVLGTNEIYDTTTNTWSTGARMPTKREGLAVAAVNGIVYAIAGTDQSNSPYDAVQLYNPASNTWSGGPAMLTASFYSGSAVDNGLIYVAGGVTEDVISAIVQDFDPKTGVWARVKSMEKARSFPFADVVGANIVAAGGYSRTGRAVEDNEVYDPSTNQWTRMSNMPSARRAGCAAAIGDSLFAAGGTRSGLPLNRLDSYDLSTNTWTNLAPMLHRVIGAASATVGGRLYCFGGANKIGDFDNPNFFNYVQIYQP